jgi:hypothetical protein
MASQSHKICVADSSSSRHLSQVGSSVNRILKRKNSLCTCNSWTDFTHPLGLLSYFEKNTIKGNLNEITLLSVCVCTCIPPPNFWIPEPIFMKLGMCTMATEPISVAYILHKSNPSVIPTLQPLSQSLSCPTAILTFPRCILFTALNCFNLCTIKVV